MATEGITTGELQRLSAAAYDRRFVSVKEKIASAAAAREAGRWAEVSALLESAHADMLACMIDAHFLGVMR